ncbi:MAG: dctB [Pseudonocardia sp.]|nr:dctB [Pseudonocardia sp.]
MTESLRQVELFADLGDDELARIGSLTKQVRLAAGEVLFHEGEWADHAFVVTDGEVEILKTSERREVLLAVRGANDVIGEMALVEHQPRSATVRARTAAGLVSIPKAALDDLLATSASAARAVFGPLIRRIRNTNDQMRHQERMVQLGILTAGVAHELNNPAAAVQRAAEHLSGDLDRLTGWLAGRASPAVAELLDELVTRPHRDRGPVEISDEEGAVDDWLSERGVDESWTLAPALVDAEIGVGDLARLGGAPVELADTARFLSAAVSVRRWTAEIAEGAHRLSEIVRALRSYSYLDRAPVQEVDVVRGIEDTLVLLGHRKKGTRVVREVDEALPSIQALGSELNQVWTNLLHNAFDALADTPDPTVTIRAFTDGAGPDGRVVVEVQDNGPGIPPETQERVFDAFFTTKEPGQGTGLGLQISHRIIVLEHHGDLTLRSEPGQTVFRVTLPIRPPTAPTAQPASATTCEHLESIEDTPVPDGGCAQCEASGDSWVHLRFCTACGAVGCCDDSKNRHATRHALDAGHPVLRSKEPGENWAWCVVDEVGTELATGG